MFQNINDMDGPCCACTTHSQACNVPTGAQGSVLESAGFSCKTVSPLNCYRSQDGASTLREKRGSTEVNLDGLMRYAKEHAPPMMIMENVPQLIDPPYDNLAAMEQGMDDAGYSMTYAIVDANTQGSLLQRKRAYLFAVRKKKFGLTSAQAEFSVEGDTPAAGEDCHHAHHAVRGLASG